MPTPIPPNLAPFVQPPTAGSLTLITSVLDATSNWLLLRFIHAALRPEKQDGQRTKTTRVAATAEDETSDNKNENLKVILISFLRPFELWKEMAVKIARQPSPPSLNHDPNL
jgi:elongator complex protein 6